MKADLYLILQRFLLQLNPADQLPRQIWKIGWC